MPGTIAVSIPKVDRAAILLSVHRGALRGARALDGRAEAGAAPSVTWRRGAGCPQRPAIQPRWAGSQGQGRESSCLWPRLAHNVLGQPPSPHSSGPQAALRSRTAGPEVHWPGIPAARGGGRRRAALCPQDTLALCPICPGPGSCPLGETASTSALKPAWPCSWHCSCCGRLPWSGAVFPGSFRNLESGPSAVSHCPATGLPAHPAPPASLGPSAQLLT